MTRECPRCHGKGVVDVFPNAQSHKHIHWIWTNWADVQEWTPQQIFQRLFMEGYYSKRTNLKDAIITIRQHIKRVRNWKAESERILAGEVET